MKDMVVIIDRIIEEHKVIFRNAYNLEKVANDAQALMTLEEGKGSFMPGRLDKAKGLNKLKEIHDKLEEGLKAHFSFEETQLLSGLKEHGDEKVITAFQTLLTDHEALRDRVEFQSKEIIELLSAKLSTHIWQPKAYDMRSYMTHTHKLLAEHANKEQEILKKLRNDLTGN